MAQQTLNNGETGLIIRGKINDNFTELYERNDFSDAERTKLSGIEEGAEVNTIDSINGKTGAAVITSSDIDKDEIDGSTDGTLTAANCKNTIINNYGQGAEDAALTLPAAMAGLNFIAIVGTTQAGNTWKFTANANDKIYLDGVAGNNGESVIVNPNIGNFIEFVTFQVGATEWDWFTRTGQGTWQGQGNWYAGA